MVAILTKCEPPRPTQKKASGGGGGITCHAISARTNGTATMMAAFATLPMAARAADPSAQWFRESGVRFATLLTALPRPDLPSAVALPSSTGCDTWLCAFVGARTLLLPSQSSSMQSLRDCSTAIPAASCAVASSTAIAASVASDVVGVAFVPISVQANSSMSSLRDFSTAIPAASSAVASSTATASSVASDAAGVAFVPISVQASSFCSCVAALEARHTRPG
mmetsp:Transcript_127308/g.248006  ORF Transcript_127308/g.248006 Transcript_127308/m.248006 type:complete len:223 (+) Transcript_127308:11-679(+)